jgi:spore maturation protein CgeB
MKILVCSQANIFEPDIIYTFNEMNFTVDKLTSPIIDSFCDKNYIKLVSDMLLTTNYDFVFSVNYIPIVSMVCQIHKVKYVSWVADSPCSELNSHTITNSMNYIFIFDKTLFNYYRKESPNTIYYLPLGSNISRLNQITLTKEEYENYHTDVSFIGSLYSARTKYKTVPLSDYWHGYYEGVIEAQLQTYGYNLLDDVISDDAINAFVSSMDTPITESKSDELCSYNFRDSVINHYVGQECSHRERIRAVNVLANYFNFTLYTTDDTSEFPIIKNKGVIEPFTEAFKVYKSSKININITSKSIKSGLPLRIFDVIGAGGFLITNYQTELPELFDINKDLVVYESTDDLIQKISYYLSHEEERLAIANNGYQKVNVHYQFTTKILQILKVVLKINE